VALDLADAASHAPALADLLEPARVDVRRRLEEERLEVADELFEPLVQRVEGRRIGGADPRPLLDRSRVVRPPGEHRPVLERGLQTGLARNPPQPVVAAQAPAHSCCSSMSCSIAFRGTYGPMLSREVSPRRCAAMASAGAAASQRAPPSIQASDGAVYSTAFVRPAPKRSSMTRSSWI